MKGKLVAEGYKNFEGPAFFKNKKLYPFVWKHVAEADEKMNRGPLDVSKHPSLSGILGSEWFCVFTMKETVSTICTKVSFLENLASDVCASRSKSSSAKRERLGGRRDSNMFVSWKSCRM